MQALPVALTLTGKARGRKYDTDLGNRLALPGAGMVQASEARGLGDGLARGWWVLEARRMSRRNSRQGKARRRADHNRRPVTERELKRPGSPGQDAPGRRESGGSGA